MGASEPSTDGLLRLENHLSVTMCLILVPSLAKKGYFGLNVVAIVDKKKRVLYWVIGSRGAEHDSTT